jgi:hypothetical protein
MLLHSLYGENYTKRLTTKNTERISWCLRALVVKYKSLKN